MKRKKIRDPHDINRPQASQDDDDSVVDFCSLVLFICCDHTWIYCDYLRVMGLSTMG